MATTVNVPSLNYSSHFYPELLEDLIAYMRVNCPELTDEDALEPHIQLARASAASGHHNMVMLDMVANEMFLPTAKLRSSHVDLLAAIGQQLEQATPAAVGVLGKLTQIFESTTTTVPNGSRFSTMAARGNPSVEYEVLADVITARTDQVGMVASWNGSNFTDHTADVLANNPWTPWTTTSANNAIYFGHTGVMWDLLRIILSARTAGVMAGVWEYYDGNLDQSVPKGVTLQQVSGAAALVFDLTTILGSTNMAGAIVRVRCNLTGAFQDVTSTYQGGINIASTSGLTALLGQAQPSLSTNDYTVGSAWRALSITADGTNGLSTASADPVDVALNLPWSVTAGWTRTTIGMPAGGDNMHWMRWRVVSTDGTPTFTFGSASISDGNQYQMFTATQGKSYEDDPLGSSDGTPNQHFQLSNFPVIDDSILSILVTEGGIESTWVNVFNFLNSTPTDKHYIKAFDDDGICDIYFGDGNNGKVPDVGTDSIRSLYRTLVADQDGNVGANTVTVNMSGIAWFATVTNPRAASGWSNMEGSTDADLMRLKAAAPIALRSNERVVTAVDAEYLATAYVAADGSRPVARSIAVEESFGPKTLEVVVVGTGGDPVVSGVLDDLDTQFNARTKTKMNCVFNNKVYATNFVPRTIDVVVTVENGETSAVLTALAGFLHPLAKDPDGNWLWSFGSKVATAKLTDIIMESIPRPTDMILTSPASNVLLSPRELPVLGSVTINITTTAK